MIFKTESGRVEYQKKYLVSGGVRVTWSSFSGGKINVLRIEIITSDDKGMVQKKGGKYGLFLAAIVALYQPCIFIHSWSQLKGVME